MEFLEPETGIVYMLIAKEQLVTREDATSIQHGIDQLHAGQGRPLHESQADLAQQQ